MLGGVMVTQAGQCQSPEDSEGGPAATSDLSFLSVSNKTPRLASDD